MYVSSTHLLPETPASCPKQFSNRRNFADSEWRAMACGCLWMDILRALGRPDRHGTHSGYTSWVGIDHMAAHGQGCCVASHSVVATTIEDLPSLVNAFVSSA